MKTNNYKYVITILEDISKTTDIKKAQEDIKKITPELIKSFEYGVRCKGIIRKIKTTINSGELEETKKIIKNAIPLIQSYMGIHKI